MALRSTEMIYARLPDGSALDYNLIFDVIDEVLGTKKIAYKEAERFMYQYKDALRNYDAIIERYDYLSHTLDYTEAPYRRNAESAVFVEEARQAELPGVERKLNILKKECAWARNVVCRMICQLKDNKQKLVMTAHYICMADWKEISRVCGYRNRWAKDVHVKAMATVDALYRSGDWNVYDKSADMEIRTIEEIWFRLKNEWQRSQEADNPESHPQSIDTLCKIV